MPPPLVGREATSDGLLQRRLRDLVERSFLALHPPTVRAGALRVRHTYYFGAIAAAVWLVMIVTGVLMMLHVRPAVPVIYHDLKDLQFSVEYGPIVRNLHRWGANAMVVVVSLHMLRKFFHRNYLPPRRGTWYLGVALFVVTFLSAHTGYLLPWDQRAYWGIAIAATMAAQIPLVGEQLRLLLLGGSTIGPNAVLRVYVFHCVVIPLATALLLMLHLALVRRTGVEGWRRVDDTDQVPAFPHLLLREVLVLQAVIIVLLSLALTGDPPLEAPANPLVTPDPIKPPWYFVGLQELLHYFPPVVSGAIAPAIVIGLLAITPFAVRSAVASSAGWSRQAQATAAALAPTATAVLAYYEAWGLLAATLIVAGAALWSRSGKRHPQGLRGWLRQRELVEWLMIWLIALAITATLTGVLFRGAGGLLTWPTGIGWSQ